MFEWFMYTSNGSKYFGHALGTKYVDLTSLFIIEMFILTSFEEWLDDIGLPQYKEYFAESKVDGRLLNNLTLVRKKLTEIYLDLFICVIGRYHLFKYY